MPAEPQSPELSEFLLRACHDLRAPLRAIRAHAELFLLASGQAPAAASAERLGFIVDGARKADVLVDAMARYAVALQTEPGLFQSIPMGVALRTALARLDQELSDSHAEVTHGELPRVLGNPDRLIELLEHLLHNALQHRGAAAPSIHITAEEQAASWLFAVRDNGPGVEPAYLERIFKPFERLHRAEGSGPGLGLAIARAIVERHGGRIWAESPAGQGATFFFTLPAG